MCGTKACSTRLLASSGLFGVCCAASVGEPMNTELVPARCAPRCPLGDADLDPTFDVEVNRDGGMALGSLCGRLEVDEEGDSMLVGGLVLRYLRGEAGAEAGDDV